MSFQITPDVKDWTWVLERSCPDCRFTAGDLDPKEVPLVVLRSTTQLSKALDAPHATERPRPGVWSPVEYGAHVTDVHRVMKQRLELILGSGGAGVRFADWDQDAAAIEGDYASRTAPDVASTLAAAAAQAAQAWMMPTDAQWQWSAERSNGSWFTTMSLGQYYAHDLVHHVWDVCGQTWTVA